MLGTKPLPGVFRSGRRFASTSSGLHSSYDVIISGGGLVGTSTALSLSREHLLSHRRILLLETAAPAAYSLPNDYNNRVVALNPSTKEWFSSLDVWGDLARFKAVRGMVVWDYVSRDNILTVDSVDDFDRDQFFIVENDLLVSTISKRLSQQESVQVNIGKTLKEANYDKEENRTRVTLSDGTELRTKILIGADGFNSTVRKSMKNVQYLSRSYGQFGVVAVLHLGTEIPNDIAWQKFLPGGPIALLPLSKNRASLVWSQPSQDAQRRMKLTSEEFVLELKKALGRPPKTEFPFPDIVEASKIAGFPLGLGHASKYCEAGLVLVGDAAHRVHPLAGQGVNLGFGDVSSLTACLRQNVADGAEFGALEYLHKYETERQRANVPMMLGIDFLHHVYGLDNPLVNAVRSVGVQAVNSSPVLKKFVANFAS